MGLSVTILFHNRIDGNRSIIVSRMNEDPIIQDFSLPFRKEECNAVLHLLETLNYPDGQKYLSIEEKLLLINIRNNPNDPSYWSEGTVLPDILQQIGFRLYNSIFHGPVGEAFRESYYKILGDGDQSKLRLIFQFEPTDTEASRYPWELLRQEIKSPLLILNRISFIRQILSTEPLGEINFSNPIRTMAVVSRPKNMPVIPSDEGATIKKILRSQNIPSAYKWIEVPPHFFDFINAVIDYQPGIIHFDGHGAFGRFCPECKSKGLETFTTWHENICGNNQCKFDLTDIPSTGYLIFEDKDNRAAFISATQIGDRLAGKGVKLITLSACQTASVSQGTLLNNVAPYLIRSGIPVVVAMQFSISSFSAELFTKRFYQSLSKENNIEVAIDDSRRILDDGDNYRPVLFMRARNSFEGIPDDGTLNSKMKNMNPQTETVNKFENLRDWTDGLLDNEFHEMIYSLLSHDLQNKLPLPVLIIDRGSFLRAMEQINRIDDVENYLTRKYADRRREHHNG